MNYDKLEEYLFCCKCSKPLIHSSDNYCKKCKNKSESKFYMNKKYRNIFCNDCGIKIKYYLFKSHLKTDTHLNNV